MVLKEKILHRIHGWSEKELSYGGRTQLIQSVLFSLQVYWSSIFIIPSKVVKGIESTLMAFLWSCFELNHKAAKVSWTQVIALKMKVVWDSEGLENRTKPPCCGTFGL